MLTTPQQRWLPSPQQRGLRLVQLGWRPYRPVDQPPLVGAVDNVSERVNTGSSDVAVVASVVAGSGSVCCELATAGEAGPAAGAFDTTVTADALDRADAAVLVAKDVVLVVELDELATLDVEAFDVLDALDRFVLALVLAADRDVVGRTASGTRPAPPTRRGDEVVVDEVGLEGLDADESESDAESDAESDEAPAVGPSPVGCPGVVARREFPPPGAMAAPACVVEDSTASCVRPCVRAPRETPTPNTKTAAAATTAPRRVHRGRGRAMVPAALWRVSSAIASAWCTDRREAGTSTAPAAACNRTRRFEESHTALTTLLQYARRVRRGAGCF